jgi:long-chain acyl-CoA synthetase
METTLGQIFDESARAHSDSTAIAVGSRVITYRELSRRTSALASSLPELDPNAARYGLLLANTEWFPIALYAVFRAGGSAVLLNPVNSRRENAEQIADASVSAVLTTTRLQGLLPDDVYRVVLDEEGGLDRVAEPTLIEPRVSAGRFERIGPSSEAVVIFTAAMRGRARGARLTHRNLASNLLATIEAKQLRPTDRVLAVLPFAHAFGLTVCLNASLAAGATVLPVERFQPAAVLDLIGGAGATVLAGVPAMFRALVVTAERVGVPAHHLRVTLCGGAPMSLDLARRWQELFGIPLRQGYGLTEAAPVCLFNRLDRPNRIGTLGSTFPGVEVSIRGPEYDELPDGEVGELCVRGANVFPGYLDAGPSPIRDGWLYTGDLASRREGVVHFHGTVKKMFTRNGFNVYPEEIRRVLKNDPRVADVRVFSRPEPLRENDIVLVVEPGPGRQLNDEDVRELCRKSLAAYKQPAEIRITEPTASGP